MGQGRKTGETFRAEFVTHDPSTGGVTNADGPPTGVLVINGTDNGATVTVTDKTATQSGVYSASVTLPTIAEGDTIELRISSTVGGVTARRIVAREMGTVKRVDELTEMTVEEIWDHLLTSISQVGSIGLLIKDNLDALVSSRASQAQVDAQTTELKGVIDTGTAQAGANHGTEKRGQITLAATAPAADTGIPIDSLVLIKSGTGAGQVKVVKSYNGTTKVAITVPRWQVIPDNTSVYENLAAPNELSKLIDPEAELTADIVLRALGAVLAGEAAVGTPAATNATFRAPAGGASTPDRLVGTYTQAPENVDRTIDISGSR